MTEQQKKLKIMFFTNIISPYMHDLFTTLTKYSDKVEFKVFVCSYKEPDREWDISYLETANYNFEVLEDIKLLKTYKKNRFIYLGGFSMLKELKKYDVIVFKGGTRLVGPFFAIVAKLLKIKSVLWEENDLQTTENTVKQIFRKIYVSENFFSSFIAYGSHVKEYIETFNKNISDKLFLACSPVKNEKFRNRYLRFRPKKNLIRKVLGISAERKVALFVGRFVDEKNLFVLIDAIGKIVNGGDRNILCLLVGGGYLNQEIVDRINSAKLNDFVKIVPFKELDKLSMFYTISNTFVLPSKWEPWGLVINEAMNFDLPVVVSDKVGCAKDIVKSGINGYIFPFDDSEKLAECILKSVKNSKILGQNSYGIIQNVNFDNVCKAILDSVSVVNKS